MDTWQRNRATNSTDLADKDDSVVLSTPTRLVFNIQMRHWYSISDGIFQVRCVDWHRRKFARKGAVVVEKMI